MTALDDVAGVDLGVELDDADASLLHGIENRVKRLVRRVLEFAG